VVDRQIDLSGPTTPYLQRLPAITQIRFGLFRFRSPLLSESLLFSLPVGTEMFHFPTFPPHALYIQAWVTGHDSSWVSPFGNPRITARLPTPQGLSQAPTSFFGSRCQGIHHVPFVACRTNTQRRQLPSGACVVVESLELFAATKTGRSPRAPDSESGGPEFWMRATENATSHGEETSRRCSRPL
jgi:hypothetical protein